MLRIYPVLLELVRVLVPRGSVSHGARLAPRGAGLLREPAAAKAGVAAVLGYLPDLDAEVIRRFDHVLGTLVNLAGGH